jgi:hypothetical protein
MSLKFTLPNTPIAAKLLSKLQNLEPVIKAVSASHVKDLQDNILREGGDPDTGEAWKTLSAKYIAHKRMIGAFLTILRRTDAMRKGITVISMDGKSYRISVTGEAKRYFAYANEARRFLGMAQSTKDRAKIILGKHLKGK